MLNESPKILTEEEVSEISNGFHRGLVTPEDAHNLIASHKLLLSANAELSIKNNELKQLLTNLDSHIDFSFPPEAGEMMEFKDVSGIAQVFKEVYRIINPEQAAINEALEELK